MCIRDRYMGCHSLNIIHRDLKPENLIFAYSLSYNCRNEDNEEIKLADFGLAKTIDEAAEKLKCGSPGYVAPEVFDEQGYGMKADVFSVGIILYIMLTGISPFLGFTQQETLRKNKEGVVDLGGKYWRHVSREAKTLVGRMTARNPKDRCTAAEALQDPWFSLAHCNTGSLLNAQDNMKSHDNAHRFDVGRIKPEFTMHTCTPLLGLQSMERGSPLLVSLSGKGERSKTQGVKLRVLSVGRKMGNMKAAKELSNAAFDYSCDFDEKEIDENWNEEKVNVGSYKFMVKKHSNRIPPLTSGSILRKSIRRLSYAVTPIYNKRCFRADRNKGSYSQDIASVKPNDKSKKLPDFECSL
eukprot:TRINITY_DN10723_c0_g2_i1.p1 TRINITY_DN10723_c0_g2~~TRINITY_DN10723_c0_g2_i1.p1  ORF type:complete len:354 (-),score=71.21 TRINITY_DN10723_c0_g2_i1:188-1249(-)